MTPATLGTGFATRVMRFCNDAEQRWSARSQYGVFVLTLTNISGFDLSNARDFFRAVKGRFDSTWSLSLIHIYARHFAAAAPRDRVPCHLRPNPSLA